MTIKKSTKKSKKDSKQTNNIKFNPKHLVIPLFIAIIVALFFIPAGNMQKFSETRNLMGTYMTITVYHENEQDANYAIERSFNEAKRLENILSNYVNDSDVSILNKNKTLYKPNWETIENIMIADFISQESYGAFDISVQPILDLYTYSFKKLNRSPTDDEIKNELSKINFANIIINGTYIKIGENQSITLGGIAKGFIVDRAIEVLQANNISSALVNAGGDLRTIGLKPNDKKWNIALSNPDNKKDFIVNLIITNKSVVTSGNYERYFDESKKFHHIIDPMTGKSANELISATIVSDSAVIADAVSTSVFVLGEEKGLEFIELFENTEGLIITNNRTIIKSSGWNN